MVNFACLPAPSMDLEKREERVLVDGILQREREEVEPESVRGPQISTENTSNSFIVVGHDYLARKASREVT